MTAVAADFTGDGIPDVIADSDNKTRLFVGPDWNEVVLDEHTAMIDGRGPMIPIRITVREDLADRARFILRDVERDA